MPELWSDKSKFQANIIKKEYVMRKMILVVFVSLF